MFVDAVKEDQDVTLATDLCIVGTGAAGLALSREFLNSQTEIIILESGGPPGESTPYDLNKVEIVGLPSYGAERGRERGFGGTTRVWPGQCMRLDSIDFSKRPWVPHSGWPITRAEIDPYYGRAEALLELPVDGLAQNIGTLLGVRQPDFDPAKLNLTFSMFSPRPDFGRLLEGAFRNAQNIMTLFHVTAVRTGTNESGALAEVIEARTLTGRRISVRARAIVLCCGGIENARLLLASNDTEPNGVGNRHDLVGRFFQDHPMSRCATIAAGKPGPLQDVFGVFYRDGVRYYPKLRLSERVQEAEGLLHCGGNVGYQFPDDSGAEAALRLARSLRARRLSTRVWRDLRYVLRDLPGAAARAAVCPGTIAHRASAGSVPSRHLRAGTESRQPDHARGHERCFRRSLRPARLAGDGPGTTDDGSVRPRRRRRIRAPKPGGSPAGRVAHK